MSGVRPIIVGGGPAGAMAAMMLARAGHDPLLLERRAVTGDAICGGFLSWRTLAQLDDAGIDVDALGGHLVRRLALCDATGETVTPLPAPGVGLSRHALDIALIGAAQADGVQVRRDAMVTHIGGHRVRLRGGETLAADALFLATGKHDVRGVGPRTVGADPELGLRVRLPASAALAALVDDRIELHLFDRGYAGLVLQEDGSANLCMAVRKSLLTDFGGDPVALIAGLADRSAALAARLSGWSPRVPIDAIAQIPYGWRATRTAPGLFRLGDQAGVISSLAGEGIGIALASGRSAAQAWTSGGAAAAPAWQARFSRRIARPMRVADAVKWAATHPHGQRIMRGIAVMPGAAALAARLTRIPYDLRD